MPHTSSSAASMAFVQTPDHIETPVKPEHVRCGECNAYCRIETELS